MALEYKSNIGIESITPILDEHVVWYGQMMRIYFERNSNVPKTPAVFQEWIETAVKDGNISDILAARLKRIHADMTKAGTLFIAKALTWDVNPLSEFNEFTRHYEEFIQFMRRIERDQALENSGVDEKTGLRATKVMKEDISREMERRARRGNPFALALIKINGFNQEWTKSEDALSLTIRKISDQIRLCLRSFDDAYYLGGPFFLVSLKHADKVGSQTASNRLSTYIHSAHIARPMDPANEIAVSIVVADPVEGDNVEDMIANMKKDLEGIDSKGTVLQYNEISPLQRYIHTIKAEN